MQTLEPAWVNAVFPLSSPCEVFMENHKQWITYVITADSEAGWKLELPQGREKVDIGASKKHTFF